MFGRMIELRLLGRVAVLGCDGERARAVLAQPRRAALIAYLAVRAPHGPERRDQLARMFWPDAEPAAARQSLRQALSFLRRAFGDGLLVTRGETRGEEEVGVDPAAVTADAVLLEELLDAGELRRAAELYRGELLEGMPSTGLHTFERWLEEVRDRHRSRMREALRRLADHDDDAGNATLAALWARREHELDPADEDSAMHLMRRLAAVGDRGAALAVYEELERLLVRELDDEPSPELVALRDEIGATSESARETAEIAMESANPAVADEPAADEPAALAAAADPRAGVDEPPAAEEPEQHADASAAFRWALALYAAAFVLVALLARVTTVAVGLPDWVFPGALLVAGLGLPAILLTGYAEWAARRAATAAPRPAADGVPRAPHGFAARLALRAGAHLSWPRTARLGTAAIGGFVLLVAGAMALRALGIGPFGTLFTAGTMRADDAIVVADLASPGDNALGRVIAQGVQADLAQSRAVRVLSDEAVVGVLRQMERVDDDLTLPVAREVAERAGAAMVVDGSIVPVGTGFLLRLRLVTADSGREVAGYQASVDSPGELVAAVGTLTRKLRARIGESLREVQASPRLEDVTTSSLDALRRYTEGFRVLARQGDRPRFVRLMREAIALDPTFAAAHLWLAAELDNRGGRAGEVARLLERAYALRDRLPPHQQRWVEYFYFHSGPPAVRDSGRALAALLAQAADRADRDRANTLNNLGWAYKIRRLRAPAESLFQASIATDTTYRYPLSNLIQLRLADGDLAGADSLVPLFRRRFPSGYTGVLVAGAVLRGRGELDSAEAMLRQALAGTTDPFSQAEYASALASIAGMEGRVRDFEAATARVAGARRARGVATADVDAALHRASFHALVVGDRPRARRILDSAAVERTAAALDPLDRPHAAAAIAYALAGDATAAGHHLAGVERQILEPDLQNAYLLRVARANVALAERRWDDAAREARLAHVGRCTWCGQLPLAMAYDSAGARDSAIAALEQMRVGSPMRRQPGAFGEVAAGPVLRRLGELYEAAGDTARAIDRYERFVRLWRRADPALQPQVTDVRLRIARLRVQGAPGR